MPFANPPAVLASLRRDEAAMCDLLERLVAAESPSLAPGAQGAAFALLARELEAVGLTVRRLRGRGTGDHLYARPRRGRRGEAAQLLVGHLDTVWPVGTLARMPVRRRRERLYGPGALDMKAGLVQMVFALRALAEHRVRLPATPVCLVAADEEIGSLDSRRRLIPLARVAARAFVLEPAFGPRGRLKTARKGVGRFTVTVHGRAAHAGVSPEQGASAILELSHQVQRLFALNDPARGITVNVGTIDGGLRANVVAPEARAVVDVRVPTVVDALTVEAAIRGLRPAGTDVSLRVEGGFGRPPMEPTPRNDALFAAARGIGEALGTPIDGCAVGGASDGNLTSLETATLDGLGGVGEGAHAATEHVVVPRMSERAALLALLLASPLPRLREPGREARAAAPRAAA